MFINTKDINLRMKLIVSKKKKNLNGQMLIVIISKLGQK